jgi:hypothetical protein
MIAILPCKVLAIAIPDIHGFSEPLGALIGARRQPTQLSYDLLPGMFGHHEPRMIYVWQSCGLR